MVCRPTTLASTYKDDLFKSGSSFDDSILSFADIINKERNPSEAFDRDKLFGLSLALNNALNKIDLSGYPTLNSKINQANFTTTELADFINQSGYSFDDVYYIAVDYNNAVAGINTNNGGTSLPNANEYGTGILTPGPISGFTTGDVVTNFSGTLINNTVTGQFDTGGSFTGEITVGNTGVFNGLDGLNNPVTGVFHVGINPVNIDPISGPTIIPSNSTTSGILDLLNALDFYLNENVASSINSGVCSIVGNVFNKLQELFSKIEIGLGLLASFLADPLGAILGAIGGVLNKLTSLANNLLGIVDSLVNSLANQVKNIVNQVTSFVQNLPQTSQEMFKKLTEKVRNLQNFFSDVTMKSLKDKIQKFVDDSSAQFEELTPESIELLLFRFCQFGEMLQSFMQRPVNIVKDFVSNMQREEELMKSVGLEQTQLATQAGAVRMSPTAIRSAQQRIRSRVNRRADNQTRRSSAAGSSSPGAPPPPDPTVYVSNNELTASERSALMNLGPEGTDRLSFAPSVLNMGKTVSDAGDNDGFARVDPNVWAKLTIVARRMDKRLTINSGYRSPEYNRRIGGAKKSMHMSAKAADVMTTGWSTEEKADFIRKCSQEGLLGIGTYSTFIHVDVGSRRFWTSGETRFNSYLAMHKRDEFRNGASGSTSVG